MESGDTAWILVSTVLVLMMTLPALGFFYAGLVQAKNVLSVLIQCMAIACVVSVLWFLCGYSLAFSGTGAWIGDGAAFFLKNIGRETVRAGTHLPESVFVMFQMTFAIITPALIIGAYVERIRYSAVLLFSGLWLLIVYVPVTHWMWVGWFGFNAGSALNANGDAGMTMLATHMSAATATLVWMAIERITFGKPSLVGAVTGTVAGLATVTPASGYIGPVGGVILGAAGSVVCYYAVHIVKRGL